MRKNEHVVRYSRIIVIIIIIIKNGHKDRREGGQFATHTHKQEQHNQMMSTRKMKKKFHIYLCAHTLHQHRRIQRRKKVHQRILVNWQRFRKAYNRLRHIKYTRSFHNNHEIKTNVDIHFILSLSLFICCTLYRKTNTIPV